MSELDANIHGQVSGIYQIRNRHTGRVYIGKSQDIVNRWLAHRSALNRGLHFNDDLQGDWEIYGEPAFEFTVLEEVTEPDALHNAEARHLAAASNSYNIMEVVERKRRALMPAHLVTPQQFFELLYDYPLPEWHIIYALSGITESTLGRLIFRLLNEPYHSTLRDFALFQDFGYRGLCGIGVELCACSILPTSSSESLAAK